MVLNAGKLCIDKNNPALGAGLSHAGEDTPALRAPALSAGLLHAGEDTPALRAPALGKCF